MKTSRYTVRFITPAFLGNAEQQGQWRTPPFKALLRQWWRVAHAADKQFEVDISSMRQEEGQFFGHAGLEDERDVKGNIVAARKSQIRLRLDNVQGADAWSIGSQQGVAPLSEGLDTSYAWFGLIDRTAIKAGAPESVRQLQLAVPDREAQRMQDVVSLIHAFGLLGSRSRGGWGALHIDGVEPLKAQDMHRYARNIDCCLKDDWAMSLAKDRNGVLVWDSPTELDSWDKAMKFIATRRKQVRMALKEGKNLRPALGFALPGRMPSPLRWKVMASQTGNLTVRVFALPHRIPDNSGQRLSQYDLQAAWQTVTRELDANAGLKRLNQGHRDE